MALLVHGESRCSSWDGLIGRCLTKQHERTRWAVRSAVVIILFDCQRENSLISAGQKQPRQKNKLPRDLHKFFDFPSRSPMITVTLGPITFRPCSKYRREDSAGSRNRPLHNSWHVPRACWILSLLSSAPADQTAFLRAYAIPLSPATAECN